MNEQDEKKKKKTLLEHATYDNKTAIMFFFSILTFLQLIKFYAGCMSKS